MKFIIYKDWSDLPHTSDRLFTEAQKDSVFFSREWFESLSPYLLNDKQHLLLACVIDNENNGDSGIDIADSIVCILPLLTHSNREWTSFTHPYSALFTILLADDRQTETLQCLSEGLKELAFDYLTLAPIADDDTKLLKFQKSMENIGFDCYQNHKSYNWFHSIEKNQRFADYLIERPSKVRNTVLRKQRKLEREHGYKIQLYVDSGFDNSFDKERDSDIQQALSTYHDIYKVSWKANEQYEALVTDVVKQFTKRAWPRLAILWIDDKPIAAQLWFVVAGKASIFRLVYDEAWKEYSPGSILMAYLLEHVIDKDKVEEIDFLSGNDGYKKDWMSERRERRALVCVNKKNTKENPKPDSLFIRLKARVFKQN